MNTLEKILVKKKIKDINNLDSSKESKLLLTELANILEYVDESNRIRSTDKQTTTYDECEDTLKKRVVFSDDDKTTFKNMFTEAKTQLAYLEKIYSEHGFCEKFAWELIYMDVLCGNMFFTGRRAYYKDVKDQEDEYTIDPRPPHYKVKNLNKEVMEIFEKGVSLIAYTARNIGHNDLPALRNGVWSLHILFQRSSRLVDIYRGIK